MEVRFQLRKHRSVFIFVSISHNFFFIFSFYFYLETFHSIFVRSQMGSGQAWHGLNSHSGKPTVCLIAIATLQCKHLRYHACTPVAVAHGFLRDPFKRRLSPPPAMAVERGHGRKVLFSKRWGSRTCVPWLEEDFNGLM
jgi:hypothetical protein